jgi:hypothetical protein
VGVSIFAQAAMPIRAMAAMNNLDFFIIILVN